MKKLRLDIDALRIETFLTQERRAGAGTVRAHETEAWYCDTADYGCYSGTCQPATESCPDDTFGETQGDCSQGCTFDSCNGCTIVH